jgi:outer membrane lipoprotein-sorting protein
MKKLWMAVVILLAALLFATGCGSKEKSEAKARFQKAYDEIQVGMTEEAVCGVLGQKYFPESARPIALQYKDKYGNAFSIKLSNGVVTEKSLGSLY